MVVFFFFFKQKTAYEMRISDWSSDVCSSDLAHQHESGDRRCLGVDRADPGIAPQSHAPAGHAICGRRRARHADHVQDYIKRTPGKSEEHTSELQSLMRISYAVFCLKKKKSQQT